MEEGTADTRPEAQEGFGEATPGEAQSEDPPSDPEMLDGDDETPASEEEDSETAPENPVPPGEEAPTG